MIRLWLRIFIIIGSGVTLAQADTVGEAAFHQSTAVVGGQTVISPRIVGGLNATVQRYPSIVALVNPGPIFDSLADRLFCGGTLVDQRWVMTAAHCLFTTFGNPLPVERIRVVAGLTDLATSDSSVTEYSVLRSVIHPDYDQLQSLPPNDIALLELSEPLANEPFVETAMLFTGESEDLMNQEAWVVGWGAIEYINDYNLTYPEVLHHASVPLVGEAVCDAPESFDGQIDQKHLCAGYRDGRADACTGDSGGPLYITEQGEQLQIGIVSYGIGCALPLYYGIYTDVSHFIPWLGQYIDVPFQEPSLVLAREQVTDTSVISGADAENGGDTLTSEQAVDSTKTDRTDWSESQSHTSVGAMDLLTLLWLLLPGWLLRTVVTNSRLISSSDPS